MDNEWKKAMKLSKSEKLQLILYGLLIIINIINVVKTKNPLFILIIILWITLGISNYCYWQMSKANKLLVDTQKKHIDSQDRFIKVLTKEILRMKNAKIVELKDIKIPFNFKHPSKEKLNGRFKYYNTYNQFKVPVILNKNNELVDGYTTYLIAKENNFSHINVLLEREEN